MANESNEVELLTELALSDNDISNEEDQSVRRVQRFEVKIFFCNFFKSGFRSSFKQLMWL